MEMLLVTNAAHAWVIAFVVLCFHSRKLPALSSDIVSPPTASSTSSHKSS